MYGINSEQLIYTIHTTVGHETNLTPYRWCYNVLRIIYQNCFLPIDIKCILIISSFFKQDYRNDNHPYLLCGFSGDSPPHHGSSKSGNDVLRLGAHGSQVLPPGGDGGVSHRDVSRVWKYQHWTSCQQLVNLHPHTKAAQSSTIKAGCPQSQKKEFLINLV